METTLLEQFKFLIRENKGIKLEKVIEQILESNLLFTNELFVMENVQELNNPPAANRHYNTLALFCRQNYLDYKRNKSFFIELSIKMLEKLKLLTVLDLAANDKYLSYDFLMNQLDIKDQFEIDSLLFRAVSSGLIQAKVDQRLRKFKVLSTKGRDYIPNMERIDEKISKWILNLENTEKYIDQQVGEIRNDNQVYANIIKKYSSIDVPQDNTIPIVDDRK